MIPMISAPIWLSNIYSLEINWWDNQISADNLAIQLAREDRQALNLEEKKSGKMKTLHQAYHKALACSLIPATALKCIQLSYRLGSMIRLLRSSTELALNSTWRINRAKALNWIAHSAKSFGLNRIHLLSVVWERCSICQLPLKWRLPLEQLTNIFILKEDTRIRTISTLFLKNEFNWEYRLLPK